MAAPEPPLRRIARIPTIWIVGGVLLTLAALSLMQRPEEATELSLTELITAIDDGEVREARILEGDQQVRGRLDDGTSFVAVYPAEYADELSDRLLAQEVPTKTLAQKPSAILGVLSYFLPILLLAALFLWMMNRAQGGSGRVMQFGRSRHKQVAKDQPKTTFKDVAGVDEAIEELEEVKDYLQHPSKYQAMGAKIPRGVLLFGPPGTGKTLLARAVAGEAGVPFFSISGSDFVEMFVGVGASRVRDLFEQAKQ
ncbi:MAG TPA: ATP-dependent metallopeptidase FtsH/Yme1/Tma family protein, partial [Actinomycetota bacterium]